MKNNIKHGLLFLGASIICAILFLYLWNTQILDDIISDKSPTKESRDIPVISNRRLLI